MLSLKDCECWALTDVLQHKAEVGEAVVGGINGCDVDIVVGEELQVGQVEVPHLRKKKSFSPIIIIIITQWLKCFS